MRALQRTLLPVIAILLSIMVSLARPAHAVDNTPIVVFREDDCRSTWRTPFAGLGGMSGLQYGKLKHIPVTWGVITDGATTGSSGTHLLWAEIKDYLDNAGGEAASHSVHHVSESTIQAYIDELTNSKAAIERSLPGYPCNTFLQPGTWGDTGDTLQAYMDSYDKLNSPIGTAIQANYSQSMAYLGNGWSVGNVYDRYGLTPFYSLDYQYGATVGSTQATLDIVAATPGLVAVCVCHGVQETGGTAISDAQADVLKAFMDKLAELRDAGKIKLMGLNDAYHTTLSSDLNHMPDPGFELCNPGPLNPKGPWSLSGSARIMTSGGVDDSRYCSFPSSSSDRVDGRQLTVPPGRYRLEWYQKAEPGTPLSRKTYTTVYVIYTPSTYPMSSLGSSNSASNTWEKKTALVSLQVGQPVIGLKFISDGGFGIDNVSIVSEPIDPAVSPSQSTATPSPGQCRISWVTPNDPSVTSICLRYGTSTHPLTTSEGIALGTIPAVPGSKQAATVSMNWSSLSFAYFSVFAVRSNVAVSPPDITWIKVDKSTPPTPVITSAVCQDKTISATWQSGQANYPIYQYQYSIGSSANGSDLVPWTNAQTTSANASIPSVPPSGVFVSVRAENAFGYWSSVAGRQVVAQSSLSNQPDGTPADITGIVTAVFADCCYIEAANRVMGIKVIGGQGFAEGSAVHVTGTMTTLHGERAIVAN